MHAFKTLDVDLGQKVPKMIDFFILAEKSIACQENNALKAISAK